MNEKYTYYNLCIGGVWILMRYFLFEKQTFNGLIKSIGIQNILDKLFTNTRIWHGLDLEIASSLSQMFQAQICPKKILV